MPSDQDFLDPCRKLIHGSGLGPTSPSYMRLISLCILLPIALVMDCFIIYGFYYAKNDILKFAELIESLSSFGQLLVRKFILIVHKRVIQEVFELRKNFWKYETFGEEHGNYLRHKMIMAKRAMQTMVGLVTMIVFCLCLSTITNKERSLPLESWTPENESIKCVFYTMQVISMAEVIYFVGTVDSFYVLMCTDIKIQFLLLKEKLRSLRSKAPIDCLNGLKTCIKHHNLLLSVHKKLNRIFSEYFLVQYFVSVLAACVQLYILKYITPSLEDLLKSLVYLVAVFVQVALFFMLASDIEEEAEQLADEIYDVDWESTSDPKIRKQLLFMLMRAQEPLCMLGGGMVHINRNEYIVLFRLAFSVSTLLGTTVE